MVDTVGAKEAMVADRVGEATRVEVKGGAAVRGAAKGGGATKGVVGDGVETRAGAMVTAAPQGATVGGDNRMTSATITARITVVDPWEARGATWTHDLLLMEVSDGTLQ